MRSTTTRARIAKKVLHAEPIGKITTRRLEHEVKSLERLLEIGGKADAKLWQLLELRLKLCRSELARRRFASRKMPRHR